jgi:hypothetical protein
VIGSRGRRRGGQLLAHRLVEDHRDLEGDTREGKREAQASVDVEIGEGAERRLNLVEAAELEFDEAEVTRSR